MPRRRNGSPDASQSLIEDDPTTVDAAADVEPQPPSPHPAPRGASMPNPKNESVSDNSGLADRRLVAAGSALGALGVVLGAFGAHALNGRITAEALGWWHTAVEYQMWHALAVVGLGLSARSWARLPAWMLAAGALVFSGTLYAMALGAPRWLGAVTPLGGLAMIGGWALLAWRAWRQSRH